MHTKKPIHKELAQGEVDPQLPKVGTGKNFKKGGRATPPKSSGKKK